MALLHACGHGLTHSLTHAPYHGLCSVPVKRIQEVTLFSLSDCAIINK